MRALPHSRQHLLWRGVINPQNGHILCALKFWSAGLSVALELINESAMLASFIRKRLSSRRKLGAIDLPYATSPERRDCLQRPGESSFSVGISGKFRMTPPGHTILCRIAHILPQACRFASVRIFRDVPSVTAEVNNLDQLFFTSGAIMMVETSTSSLSLFQVL